MLPEIEEGLGFLFFRDKLKERQEICSYIDKMKMPRNQKQYPRTEQQNETRNHKQNTVEFKTTKKVKCKPLTEEQKETTKFKVWTTYRGAEGKGKHSEVSPRSFLGQQEGEGTRGAMGGGGIHSRRDPDSNQTLSRM